MSFDSNGDSEIANQYPSMFRLQTDAQFINVRGAIIASAKALGFNNSEQQAIKDAFDKVGIVEPDSVRIVLTWGATPRDLDSHLFGPMASKTNETFHVYYGDKNYYDQVNGKRTLCADLDYDDVTSYGPEVTTIHNLKEGTYYFSVHDYTNGDSLDSRALANSGAVVSVYRGSSKTPIASCSVDRTSKGTHWNVFKLIVDSTGSYIVRSVNTYGPNTPIRV